MTEEQHRRLTIELSTFAKHLQELKLEPEVEMDRSMAFYYVRFIGALIRDIRLQYDLKENPEKFTVEYTKKDTKNGHSTLKSVAKREADKSSV